MSASRSDLKQLHAILLDTYLDRDHLEMMVGLKMNVKLDDITSPVSSLTQTISTLLEWADARNRLEELIAAVYEDHPDNLQLRAVVESLNFISEPPTDKPVRPKSDPDSIVILYSHKDEKEKEQLLAHLAVLSRVGLIEVWTDRQIQNKSNGAYEFQLSLEQARVVIMLVTVDFLASNFVLEPNISRLLDRPNQRVVPLIAKPCAWMQVGLLASRQAFPKDLQPIWSRGKRRADEELAKFVLEVANLMKIKTETATLHLDLAAPNDVSLGQPFEVAVALRKPDSPSLEVERLDQVYTSTVQFTWVEVQDFINMRLELEAPSTEINNPSAQSFRLFKGQDSEVFNFQLMPLQSGSLQGTVSVYRDNVWLAGASFTIEVKTPPQATEFIYTQAVEPSLASRSALFPGMPLEEAEAHIAAFARRFGPAHLDLACHAALPLSLTPDLLYSLWANFQRNEAGQILKIEWVAVADLLLSNLCSQVGYELFEMDRTIRALLLRQLEQHPDFGPARLTKLSHFLLEYTEARLNLNDWRDQYLAQTQRWTAWAYIDPERVERDLARNLAVNLAADRPAELMRLGSIVERFTAQLPPDTKLASYTRGMAYLLYGQKKEAIDHFRTLYQGQAAVEIGDSRLPIPQAVLAELALEAAPDPKKAQRPPYFTLVFDQFRGWVIDVGREEGLPDPEADDSPLLAIFPSGTSIQTLTDLSPAIGWARVVEVGVDSSKVELVGNWSVTPNAAFSYKAVSVDLPLTQMTLYFEGEEKAVAQLRLALSRAGTALEKLVVESDNPQADITLAVEGEQYILRQAINSYGLQTLRFTDEALLSDAVVHIARWVRVVRLANPLTRLADDSVTMEIIMVDGLGNETPFDGGAELRHRYSKVGDEWKPPLLKFKLINNTTQTLYCGLINLTPSYKIWPVASDENNQVIRINPQSEAWVVGGGRIKVEIPDELWKQGLTELADLFKLIISTNEFDPKVLEQGALSLSPALFKRSNSFRSRAAYSDYFLRKVVEPEQTRGVALSGRLEPRDYPVDWSIQHINSVVVRPPEVVWLSGGSATLPGGISLEGPAELGGQAELTNTILSGLDLPLPPWFRHEPIPVHSFELFPSPSARPGLDILLLSDIQDHTLVSPERPLILKLERSFIIDQTSFLLVYGYDGEFYLPLGRVERHEWGFIATLDMLPPPAFLDENSPPLLSNIPLFFIEVRPPPPLDLGLREPALVMVEAGQGNSIAYVATAELIRAQVSSAEQILLLIPSRLQDREAMVSGVSAAIGTAYDLILVFAYEDIVFSLHQLGYLLKERLEAIGLGRGHGKTLCLVAHGLGGLTARWFIEKGGGHQVVQSLVMLGTPNSGKSWAYVPTWVQVMLAFGLNEQGAAPWSAAILTLLLQMQGIDYLDDETQPGSELIATLSSSPDPNVPYTIIAGDMTSLETGDEETLATRTRLLERLNLPDQYLPLFNQPNDLAVTIASMKVLPPGRSPLHIIREVPCDHLTYFTNPIVRQVLAEVLTSLFSYIGSVEVEPRFEGLYDTLLKLYPTYSDFEMMLLLDLGQDLTEIVPEGTPQTHVIAAAIQHAFAEGWIDELIGQTRAVGPLIAALNDKNWNMRRNATEALGKLGGSLVVEPLIATLKDENKEVRSSAAEALGHLGDTRAVGPLIAALNDRNNEVRRSAAQALGRLGDARAIEPLSAALNDRNNEVRRSAAQALGQFGDT